MPEGVELADGISEELAGSTELAMFEEGLENGIEEVGVDDA